jgi:3-dehydroquinate synthetase
VFYGLIFEVLISRLMGKIKKKKSLQLIEVANAFEKRIGMLEIFKKTMKIDDIIHSLSSDKINNGNKFKFVIPTDNGYMIAHDVPKEIIEAAISDFQELCFEKYDK